MSKTSQELRRAFLEFFRSRGHAVVESGALVPPNDPTLMFANAGMVQFKDCFTGREKRAYTRAASSQKCIRISGKHNDLENVGPSPRHHTFFEMLGNFSFGDYFKEEAIVFAWDFLIKEVGLDPSRFVFTYFKGEEGVPADAEARELWRKVTGMGDDRVLGLGMADNFWAMGDTGPCGPCSELHYYVGPEVDLGRFGQEQTAEGHGWMEIWNLVFMQFERKQKDSALEPLPAPSIDTGMGLERLAGIVQGKTSNYDSDLLRTLVERAAELSKKPYAGGMTPDEVSMRVIADHARTTAFLIAEGIMPDRTGREYVLRRVMRRAIRHGHRLGIAEPFLHDVADLVVTHMGEQYPELRERREMIRSVAEAEEVRFRQTIERGLSLLELAFDAMKRADSKELSGADAFQLYDTYGFPLDLTQVICAERGYAVDVAGYDAALEEARKRSEFRGMEQAVESVYRDALGKLPSGAVAFSGYERDVDKSRVVAIVKAGTLAESAEAGDAVELVTERTPFYGEAGGQVGDHGSIVIGAARLRVTDTQKPVPGLVVHRATVEEGGFRVGDEAELRIDVARRDAIRKNHSATHLLHWALRQVVGSHAQQKGSLVGPERLRFDFTHGKALSPEELTKIEDLVNQRTLANAPVRTEVLSMDEAKKRGAMMIFEEKYGDTVRLLSMAESVELCGGTHARATGDIGLFKIQLEQGIAAGVRRIVATTGEGSLAHLRTLESELGRAAQAAKASPAQLVDKIEKLVAESRSLEKKVEELQKKLLTGGGGGGMDALLGKARDLGGVKVLGVRTEVTDRGALRELAEQLRDKLGDSIVLVGSEVDGKAQLVLTVAKQLTDRFKAGELIRPIAAIVGGSGGGRPDMAQAGGTDPAKLEQAIEAVYQGIGG
ncbi:MAG: alanine--tRNA ligase [Polyangiaceae bacterium]|nr:alanine--tRNA ligase [Polyangiaceae bacterium]MCL4755331.1 alanine--tRNA ligase [Myxococcales bacterium]